MHQVSLLKKKEGESKDRSQVCVEVVSLWTVMSISPRSVKSKVAGLEFGVRPRRSLEWAAGSFQWALAE